MPWSSTATADDGGPTRWNTKKALPMETVWRTASSSAGKPCVWKRCLPRPPRRGPVLRHASPAYGGAVQPELGKKRSGPSRPCGRCGKRRLPCAQKAPSVLPARLLPAACPVRRLLFPFIWTNCVRKRDETLSEYLVRHHAGYLALQTGECVELHHDGQSLGTIPCIHSSPSPALAG